MLFAVQFSYRVAMAPLPTLFITACSKSKESNRDICIQSIFTVLTTNLEIAQKEFGGIIIANEPTSVTHDIAKAKSNDFVTVCTSLHFKTMNDLKSFIAKTTPGAQLF